MGCATSSSSSYAAADAQGVFNLKSRTFRAWPKEYPRPLLRRDGSSILLLNAREFCSQPPEPFPDWLKALGITPAAWRELVWTIDCEYLYAMELDRGPGMHGRRAADETQIMPRVSVVLAAYVARIAKEWATRGLRIEFIEGPIVDARERASGNISCRMDNRLLFSPMSLPAPERPSAREVLQSRAASTGQAIWLRDLQLNSGARAPAPATVPPTITPSPAAAQTNNSSAAAVTPVATTHASSTAAQGHELAQPAPSAVAFPNAPSAPAAGDLLMVVAPVSTPPATAETVLVDTVSVVAHAAIVGELKTDVGELVSCPSCGASLQPFVVEGHPRPRFCPQCAAPLAQG